MQTYIVGIHQRTGGTRVLVLDRQANVVASAFGEITQHFPRPGWVEHDAEEIWQVTRKVAAEALQNSRIAPEQVAAVGVTNQRDTTVFWDRRVSQPVGRAIVWQDLRTVDICRQLSAHDRAGIEARTGMIIVPDVTGAKIRWLLDNDRAIQKGVARNELLCGTIDSWLIWKLSGGAAHVTDHSNASVTLLLNATSLTYDDELLNWLAIPRDILPKLRRSSEVYGYTDPDNFLGIRAPIAAAAGDQQVALFGQACLAPGTIKNTYSSGSFMLVNTGDQYLPPAEGLFSPVLWTLGEAALYGLEGKADVAGDVIQWLQSGLGLARELGEVEGLASQVTDTHGVYLVPPRGGSDVIDARTYAQGAILGIQRGVTKHHIARAALEALAFQARDHFEVIRRRAPELAPQLVRADGRIAKSDFLLQFQADILGLPVERPVISNTAALGIAFLAGLAVGYWDSVDETAACWRREIRFEPRISDERREALYDGWREATAKITGP